MSRKPCLLLFSYLTIIVSAVLSIRTSPDANYVSFPTSENGTCYKRIPYDDEVANKLSSGSIQLASGSQTPPIKSNGSSPGWVTVIDCCEGYARDPDSGLCETNCDEGCFGGKCVGPNQCQCEENWHPENGVCKPICHRPCAENAYCFSPGVCTCLFGFEERDGACRPVCLHDCENGDCVAPRQCQCHQGYRLNETKHCEPVCESGCPHGQCYRPEMCLCDDGYDISRYTPETCVPRCPRSCINGECHSPDVCTCKPGYGEDNDGTCQPICREGCENGQCVAPERCQCDPPFVFDPQSKKCITGRGGSYHQADYESDRGYGYSTSSEPPLTGPHYVTNSPTGPYGAISTYRPQSSSYRPNSRDRPENYGEEQLNRPHYQTNSPNGPYGSVSTYRPQVSNRYPQSRDTTDNFGVIPIDQNPELQPGGIYNRNRENEDPQRPSNSRDRQRDNHQSSHIQKIDGPTRNPARPDNSRDRYGNQQSTEEPQRFLTESSSDNGYSQGRDSYRTSTPSYGYGNIQTHERPRPDQENLHGPRDHSPHNNGNYGQRTNQTHRFQGPFPPEPNSDFHNQRPYDAQGYDQAQNPRGFSNPTQRPYNSPSYNQAQNLHSSTTPYDTQRYGQTGRPENTNHPYHQHHPGSFQETLTENDNIEGSTRPYQNHNRPYDQTRGRYDNPQRQQGSYGSRSHYSTTPTYNQESRTENENIEGTTRPYQNSNRPSDQTQGRYNTPQRPQGNYGSRTHYSTTPSNAYQTNAYDTASQKYPYSDKSTGRPYPGQNPPTDVPHQGYGRDRTPVTQSPRVPSRYPDPIRSNQSPTSSGKPIYGSVQNQPQLLNNGNYDVNFDMINHSGNDGIVQGLPVDGLVIPVINQYGAFCEVPCLNGQCIGPNVCLCNPGYGPDMNNPYSSQCVPMCSDGCFNGSHTSWHKRPACCSNHTEFGDDLCIPKCEKSCGSKGICAEPDICKCDSGYEYNHSLEDCEPVCSDECVNGVCTSPNECTCHNGYHMQPNGYHCTPTCETCSNLEYCSEPHICKCLIGYNRTSMERVDTAPEEVCNPVCERECVNSDCVEPNLCKCHPGYVDEDDDIFTCEPKCSQGCTNGECTAPETCVCATGYETKGNVTHICNPICSPECINGECIAPDLCSCPDGYSLSSNETFHICEPVCLNGCDPVHGICSAPDVCSCSDGYQMGTKDMCEPICNNSCINAKCTAPNECTCIDGYVKKNASDVNSTCIVKCECEHGFCKDTDSVCDSCADGYDLSFVNNSTICKARCDHSCENGQCVEPQKCACNDFYVPADDDDLGNSHCVHACGGQCAHGVCNVENRSCSCHYGWAGKLCDEPMVCRVIVPDNETSLQLNETLTLSKSDADSIELPWTGKICSELCQSEIRNTSECMPQNTEDRPEYYCFMKIDSQCNSMSNSRRATKPESKIFTSTIFFTTLGIIAIAAVFTTVFVFKRRRDKSIELVEPKQYSNKQEENCLIEDDNTSVVSL
ncbi:hypothetical protein QAD02_018228 [Eretmocerus hayati]|uniref:Uncharacterized protein n=1 Tax=Eretmocerus hayati TaxID=131215 RepID=A0ACC2PI00_9HYME|nr:hypothetical protein QAD02_018228 [Eretmocerus hayati]